MKEQEIYDALCAYIKTKDVTVDEEGARMSFLVIAATETDGKMSVGNAIVDPGIPDRIKGPPISCTVAQQTVFYLKDNLEQTVIEATEAAVHMWKLGQAIGVKRLKRIAAKCNSAEEFQKRLLAYVEGEPEIQLDFEVDVEKHGTG